MQRILITGVAGFIGFHLARLLSRSGYQVTGIDSLNNYYDVKLKLDRLELLKELPTFSFRPISICDKDELDELFAQHSFHVVINLAAQAGVRYSIEKPYKYIDSNLIGFINILEACRHFGVEKLLFASSSSIYGNSNTIPFSEDQKTDEPVSLYAATKKANELMAHSYAHLYGFQVIGLRFFTVYGPWGRPDMAYFKFTRNILEGLPIQVYHKGELLRDFTHINDIIRAVKKLMETTNLNDFPLFRIYNIGNNKPVRMIEFIETLQRITGKKALVEHLPMQDGDVKATCANIDRLTKEIGYIPSVSLERGLAGFVEWYCSYYNIEVPVGIIQ
jgi:UDP-glucuronate 4-epimerase